MKMVTAGCTDQQLSAQGLVINRVPLFAIPVVGVCVAELINIDKASLDQGDGYSRCVKPFPLLQAWLRWEVALIVAVNCHRASWGSAVR